MKRKVAGNKLRIKGKFVTKEQAVKILGMSPKEIQKLLREQL